MVPDLPESLVLVSDSRNIDPKHSLALLGIDIEADAVGIGIEAFVGVAKRPSVKHYGCVYSNVFTSRYMVW